MKKDSSPLRVRIAYEPNRFSSQCLVKVYERLGPTVARTASNGHETAEPLAQRAKPAVKSQGKS